MSLSGERGRPAVSRFVQQSQKDDEQRQHGGPGSNPDQNRPDQAQSDEIRRNGSDSNRGGKS